MSSRNRYTTQGVVFAGYDNVVQADTMCVCVCAHGCYFGSVIISRTGGVTSVLWLFDNTWVLSAHWRWICLRDILPCFCVRPRAHCQTSPTDTKQRTTDLADQRIARDFTLQHLLMWIFVIICNFFPPPSFLGARFSVNPGDVVMCRSTALCETPNIHFKSRLNRLFPPILMLTLNVESAQLNEWNCC